MGKLAFKKNEEKNYLHEHLLQSKHFLAWEAKLKGLEPAERDEH